MRIRVIRDNRTLQTVGLEPGAILVGRDEASDLRLSDTQVSRRHCELRLESGRVTITDLGSQNGTLLDGVQLPVSQPSPWEPGQTVQIGPFTLQLSAPEQAAPASVAPASKAPAAPWSVAGAPSAYGAAAGRSWSIACGLARPSVVSVKERPIVIGRDATCDMVLDDNRVSRQQARVHQQGGQLWVTDLSQHETTRIDKQVLPAGVATPWPEGTLLQVGPFAVSQSVTVDAAAMSAAQAAQMAQAALAADVSAEPAGQENISSRMWQSWFGGIPWLPISIVLGGICLVLGIAAGVYQIIGGKDEPTPVAEATATLAPGETPLPTETPLPSPTPSATPQLSQTGGSQPFLPTNTPLPTLPPCTPQATGWLNLPFPYDGKNETFGTAEQFRQASQRTANGGRINSFFDHQFPLYTREGGVLEQTLVDDTLILFDGSRSLDKATYPKEDGDFYSGHPGIDFAPFEWGKSTTPILAPADAVFVAAGIDELGNTYVLLLHDRGDAGVFRTSYLHLEKDEYFSRMVEMEENTPIRAGERIGTMGNEGNSSGHHLHFEVRKDCNQNGRFDLSEAVDPYGFMPSFEVGTDPLAALACGGSEYLWQIPWDPEDTGGGCARPEQRRQLDPAPFQGVISIATFIFTTARPGTETTVPVRISDSMAARVDIAKIKAYRLEPDPYTGIGRWVVVEPDPIIRTRSSGLYAEVVLSTSGKFTLTGRPLDDIIPPQTSIRLIGQQDGDVYVGTVSVELTGTDNSPQGVREIKYSLDCGQSWQTYSDRPFNLTVDDVTACGRAEEAQKGNEWGLEEGEYLILAASVDWSGNFEQPASPLRFKIQQ